MIMIVMVYNRKNVINEYYNKLREIWTIMTHG